MTPNELVELIKKDFPNVVEPTYQEIERIYGDEREEIDSYTFIEVLANTLNDKMNQNSLNIDFDKFFETIRKSYLMGDEKTKEYIDVGLVENLFWQVQLEPTKYYWQKLPPMLQDLYINFHGFKPYSD